MRAALAARSDSGQLVRSVVAACLALAISIGVGRFAFTPILPDMEVEEHFSHTTAGYLAALNYLGYLIGAFGAGIPWIGRRRTTLYRLALVLNVCTTGAMAFGSDLWSWGMYRFLSGVSSGVVFVLASSLVLDRLVQHGRSSWSGFLYAGTGIGIVISGSAVAAFGAMLGWRASWLALTALSGVLSIPALRWIPRHQVKPDVSSPRHRSPVTASSSGFPWLVAAYACEGIGYIVTATFLVAIVSQTRGLAALAPYFWIVVGLAASPSCLAWTWISQRVGSTLALLSAYLLQAIGIMLPVVSQNELVGMIGSLLFGGTFMGITALATTLARELHPQQSNRAIAIMTGTYGIGQIAGAAGAGEMARISGGFSEPTIIAAAIVALGILFLFVGAQRTKATSRNESQLTV